MSYKIYTTDYFEKELKKLAKKYASIKIDFQNLIEKLKSDPTQGIALGKDCYKIRMSISSKGKGKRSGSRVITCVKIKNETIYLISIYDKSDRESIDDKKLDYLLKRAGIH
jgi:mRNA-degrading endonuclease RelE of RelBE toxin-antitoxin system